jgi:hypothetical protein
MPFEKVQVEVSQHHGDSVSLAMELVSQVAFQLGSEKAETRPGWTYIRLCTGLVRDSESFHMGGATIVTRL